MIKGKKITVLFFFFLFTQNKMFSQNPGGVSTNLTSWFKADQNVTGSPISSWGSSGGSAGAIALTQATASKRPSLVPASSVYKNWSYMSPIGFTPASSTFLSNTSFAGDLVTSTGVIFMISDFASGWSSALTYKPTSGGVESYQFKPQRIQSSSNGSIGYIFNTGGSPANTTATSATEFGCFSSGSAQSIDLNSVSTTAASSSGNIYVPAIGSGLFVGANPTGDYSNNNIAEVITYNAGLTATQINQVESYLSIKYGITKGGNAGTGTAYNYVASNGTTVFDKSLNAGYTNDIAGIAQDNASGLNKVQSISVNTSDPVSIGLGTVAASNASNGNTFPNDLSFLMWGNNGQPCTSNFSTTTFPAIALPAGIQAILQRVWKVQATNFPTGTSYVRAKDSSNTIIMASPSPAVMVAFETSLLTAYLPISNLRLLVSNSGTSWAGATVYSGATLVGGQVQFPNVVFSSTQRFFTLGTINYGATPLPIELTDFSANCQNNAVQLSWQTALSNNLQLFVVERSSDAINWKSIGAVNALGATNAVNNYTFNDSLPLQNIGYYRLKQVFQDGTSIYNNLITYADNCNESTYTIFPNPGNNSFQVSGYEIERVDIYSITGQLLYSQVTNPLTAYNTIDTEYLKSGTYVVKITKQNGTPVYLKWFKTAAL